MVHEPAVALIIEGTYRVVLVEVETSYTIYFQFSLLVHLD